MTARSGPPDPGEDADAPAPSSIIRRQRLFLAAAVTATLISVGGLAASTLVKSPEQVAADSRAPAASTLTAPVERRVLSSTVIARGLVAASRQVQVTPAGAAGGGGRSGAAGDAAQGGSAQLLTGVSTAAGKLVKEGDVPLAVSGRPLIALRGRVPFYRDLRPSDTGDDVAILQRALAGLGYAKGSDKTGTFGPGTKNAVKRLYTDRGYRVPDTGGVDGVADRDKLRSAQQAVTEAQDAVDDMKRQMRAKPDKNGSGGGVPQRIQLQRLQRTLRAAKQAQDELIASTGPMIPVSEVVVLPSFPARVTQFSARVGDAVKAPLLVLAVGRLGITAELPPDQGRLLKPGMKVHITSESLGIEAEGTISGVGQVTGGAAITGPAGGADETGAEGQGGGSADATGSAVPHVPVRITPDGKLDDRWAGQDVRLTITSASTSGAVLVVPLSAVTSGADGRTTVSKIDDGHPGAATIRVQVTAGMSGDGFVEITPAQANALGPGDRVVVGG